MMERKKYINEEYVHEVLMFYYNATGIEKETIKKTKLQEEEETYQVKHYFQI